MLNQAKGIKVYDMSTSARLYLLVLYNKFDFTEHLLSKGTLVHINKGVSLLLTADSCKLAAGRSLTATPEYHRPTVFSTKV